jgi:hypothetical protein
VKDITISGSRFRITRLDSFSQLHVIRRIGPAIVAVLPALLRLITSKEAQTPEERKKALELLMSGLPDATEAFARMPDHDVDYIVNKCLDVSYMLQGDAVAKIRDNGVLMNNTLSMTVLLRLSYEVIKDSCGADFFPTDPAPAAGPAPAA